MCLGIRGKVLEINEDYVVIESNRKKMKVNPGIKKVKVGDEVLVFRNVIVDIESKSR